tara:strand:+ start:3054 stop:3797 length:744 start_codon:yes stop_codon:yes gene_type:complete
MNKDNQLILWDIGGVLVELNYGGMYAAGAKASGKSVEQFEQDYIDSGIEPLVLAGKMTHEEYQEKFREILNMPDATESELAEISSNSWKNQIDETVLLKKRLHESGYNVGLFSNIDDNAIKIIGSKFPDIFETWGGPKIYSHHRGAVKPGLAMYEGVLKSHCWVGHYHRENFDKVILIEDKAKYLQPGIEKFGWNGILFTPYIDSSEAIRQTEGSENISLSPKNFRQADNIQQLERALTDFGINLAD